MRISGIFWIYPDRNFWLIQLRIRWAEVTANRNSLNEKQDNSPKIVDSRLLTAKQTHKPNQKQIVIKMMTDQPWMWSICGLSPSNHPQGVNHWALHMRNPTLRAWWTGRHLLRLLVFQPTASKIWIKTGEVDFASHCLTLTCSSSG